ncbi:MAG TPA: ketoacyl-ACP synthase III [Prolixibacteraceae bacterium]|nr:ketoacyl-ACP synthase III [Prolixibacteraceae bacterium]
MKAFIKAISYYLPSKTVTNEDLVKDFPEWTAERVAGKVGINQRHIAAKNETAVDMATQAAEKLFTEHAIDRSSIDFVLLCTQSPDYFLPTSACLLQNRLGLSTTCGALDFNLGCSGFVYGLSLAKGLITANIAKNVLLLTAETYSKHIHPKDKGNRTIFGDASAATLISIDGYASIEDFCLGTDGRGAENLIVKKGGLRQPIVKNDLVFDENGNPTSSDYLFMNGGEIFNFTSESVPIMVGQVLEKNNLLKDEIQLFVFHQANKYMMNYLRKLIDIELDRFYFYLENVGNTVSSTIPIALYEAQKDGKMKGNILLAGFGVGYSWGATILKCL